MTTTKQTHKVQCPTCQRSVETHMRFYVPSHTVPRKKTTCQGSNRPTKPGISADGQKQLCYKCGKYCSRTESFCPHCDK